MRIPAITVPREPRKDIRPILRPCATLVAAEDRLGSERKMPHPVAAQQSAVGQLQQLRMHLVVFEKFSFKESGKAIGPVSGYLPHPNTIELGKNPSNLYPAGRQVDGEQDHMADQAVFRPYLNSEEIGCSNDIPMNLEELLSGGLFLPLRCWLNSRFL